MKHNKITVVASLFALALSAQAQINLSTLSYSQNFNSGLGTGAGTWADNSTLSGWYASTITAGVVSPFTTAWSSGTGGGTSSTTLYSLGVTSDAERALGAAASSATSGMLGMRLVNISGSAFSDIQMKFDLEQWSDRGTANVTMSYQIFSPSGGNLSTTTGWIDLLTVASPLPVGAPVSNGLGNTTGLVADNIGSAPSITWNNGDELWVKWTFSKITGANSPHGIDNIVISAVPEPSTAALLGLGLLLVIKRFRSGRKG